MEDHSDHRLTLGGALALLAAAAALLVAVILNLLLAGWQRSIMERARSLREETTGTIASQVEATLDEAPAALEHVESLLRLGAIRPQDLDSLEAGLFAQVLSRPALAEIALTHAPLPDGAEQDTAAWQLSVFRVPGDPPRILTRRIARASERFLAQVRARPPGGGLWDTPLVPVGEAPDPGAHLTFRTTASPDFYGQTLWSDLHWAEMDEDLPPERRRVVVTVTKAVEDRAGRFLGVVRVGLLTEEIDTLVRTESVRKAPHVVFICDDEGRLVSRLSPQDRFREEADESLRAAPAELPVEVRAALADPARAATSAEQPLASGAFEAGGRRFLVTYRALTRTLGWRVGMVAPEDYYLGGYQHTRNRALAAALALAVVIVIAGGAGLRALRRGLGRIVDGASRMRRFDFSPATARSVFRDVQGVMESLELAKTALRAMGKYVPIDLVRHLYETRREPMLGGELLEVTILFTDVKDFTTLSEALSPDELAERLGRYLEVMTAAVHGSGGIVDKYVGDAVMAIWNAPQPVPDHARRACVAALSCAAATRRLFASPAWGGRPPLVTRFGIHTDRVLVGHFGAPDRLSFTALGDGVNLASRLEGLNKQYGTTMLVTEAVRERAGEGFVFRRLDRVAVKGRHEGVEVFELREAGDGMEELRVYERALALYRARDFAEALGVLEALSEDPPSRVLAERCRQLLAAPPGRDWDGVAISMVK